MSDLSHAVDRDALDAGATSLAAAVAATGVSGPVLVVADQETIGRRGPVWGRLFSALGRPYRVRLGGGGPADIPIGRADPRDVADVLDEAGSLRAVVIVGAGAAAVVEAARRAAAEAGLPFVTAEAPAN